MSVRIVERSDDADAIAAARAAFWARWRGGLSSAIHTHRPRAKPIAAPASVPQVPPPHELNSTQRRNAQSLEAWFERCIARELSRCEQRMTPYQGREHCDWIEEHARACLLDALEQRAARGELSTKETPCSPLRTWRVSPR